MTADPVLTKRPCPFCQSNDLQVWVDGNVCNVSCKKCGTQGPVAEFDFEAENPTAKAKASAVAQWDQRKRR